LLGEISRTIVDTEPSLTVERSMVQSFRPTIRENAALELRTLSGLDVSRLAELFGVSRVTYHGWLNGATPRGSRLDHLLSVLSCVREMNARKGSAGAVSEWLLTPLSQSSNRLTPFDLLKAKKFDVAAGYLIRSTPIASSIRKRPVRPSRLRKETHAARRLALKRLGQASLPEDDD
jgi:transcriptional regulator with XRE-family HTH domain